LALRTGNTGGKRHEGWLFCERSTAFNESHIAQMTGYLSHTGLRLGLLLNFKHAKLQWKRIVK